MPAERAQMRANSPISQLDKIKAPLLVIHGANDVRVLKGDSDDVVAALKARNHPVDYLVFADEGHSISKWRNRLAMWRTVEDTLATCLGGRSNGLILSAMPRRPRFPENQHMNRALRLFRWLPPGNRCCADGGWRVPRKTARPHPPQHLKIAGRSVTGKTMLY
ncbi:MAG: prolyl oligopeptidase family serine peptidase [Betaproteobacteria bacterium]|nr:prolyl oligopeptidase family serine peptidase [Betaproteobacteria bacterium]